MRTVSIAEILKTALTRLLTSTGLLSIPMNAPTQTGSGLNEEAEKENEILKPMTDLLLEMLKHYGIKEIAGKDNHNPAIVAMFKEIGFEWVNDDETSWCSAALNYFCKKMGYERSGRLDARSWLRLPVMVLQPEIGDIVVFWRKTPNSWEGHVGLFISWDEKSIYVLGGNQSDMLSIAPYPRERLLGFRRARKLSEIKNT
jgi:uncharacterized protein (TIGR02594 family)